MNKQRLYADGIESITYAESLVRLDLYCIGEKKEKGFSHEITAQLLLSPEGLLRAYEAMGVLIERMEKGGVIRRQPSVSTNNDKDCPASSSPNFN